MYDRFIFNLEKKILCEKSDRILLAVSGGIDSVSMVNLFHAAGYKFGIAHCNFQLRGKESDQDENFVQKLAAIYKAEIHTVRFDTKAYCDKQGLSVQMGARELRYKWFNELAESEKYQYISIAHNLNDLAETMIINLIRGTGLKGLSGMKSRHGKIIRPLLFASRTEIENFAKKNCIEYREDSSNSDTKYQRNLIRHEIIPLMQKINPSLIETLEHESKIFDATHQVYQREIDHIRSSISSETDGRLKLSISKIQALRLSPPLLFDVLLPYGFNYSDAADILHSLDSDPGKTFYSNTHILLKDRNYLIIEKLYATNTNSVYAINKETKLIKEPLAIEILKKEYTSNIAIPRQKEHVLLDYEKLRFPLQIRKWKEGDYFIPLGMKGRKKLSDYFTDQKIDRLTKSKIWILESDGNIVWVIGYQISDGYKITPETKNLLSLRLID